MIFYTQNPNVMKSAITFLCFLFVSIGMLFGQGPNLRSAVRLDQAINQFDVSGEGVVVVMIDRGIDYTHPDFIDEDGNTRIKYLFDMLDDSGANAAENPYGVGTIFTEEQINQSLDQDGPPLSTDRFGHGTACTGIILGDGSGTNDRQFKGVAPGAVLISIKVTHDFFPPFGNQPGQDAFFDASYIPIALQFAKDKIQELGLPSVTLINLGSIGGPTDGTSTISRAITDFVEDGFPLVCGVGDDGGADNYARGNVEQGSSADIEIQKGNDGFLRFDLWYSEQDRFAVSIERPDGSILGPFSAPAGPNARNDQTSEGIRLFHRGKNLAFYGATSDRREILIDLTGPAGTYIVKLEGTSIGADGLFQATLNPSRFNINTNRFTTYVTPGYSINDYSSAVGAISPTDYVATTSWTSINGSVFGPGGTQGNPGELWIGSSAGPTHDGRLGTDFATPGELAVGAYSPNTYYANATANVVAGSNGLYGIQNAVSAAAPVATGIIALMLEINPNLSPDELLALLHASCIQDSFTGEVPNPAWGYGKLDALLALQNTAETTAVRKITSGENGFKVYPNPFREEIFLEADQPSDVEEIRLNNSLGQIVWRSRQIGQRQAIATNKKLKPGFYSLLIIRKQGDAFSIPVIKQ